MRSFTRAAKSALTTVSRRPGRRFPAETQTSPIGNWSVVKNEHDGDLQWAYKGKPLYTRQRSRARGPVIWTGIMLRRSRAWRPIMATLCRPFKALRRTAENAPLRFENSGLRRRRGAEFRRVPWRSESWTAAPAINSLPDVSRCWCQE